MLFSYYLSINYMITVTDYSMLIQGYEAVSNDVYKKAFVFVFSTHAAGTTSYTAAEAC